MTEDKVIDRLGDLLQPLDALLQIPSVPSDHPLASMFPNGLTPAAVLVPLIQRDRWHVLLTQRSELLNNHGGQISFPGGRCEPGDLGFAQTALRETHEEIGISADRIRLLGFLDPQPVITGFGVVPVVGIIRPDSPLTLDAGEVAEAFEVPLDFLLNRRNYARESIKVRGSVRYYDVVQYENWRIWGATAGMLMNLATRWDND